MYPVHMATPARTLISTISRIHGETIVESPLEELINQWLTAAKGTLVKITQSESEHAGAGHHITLCVWYVPAE